MVKLKQLSLPIATLSAVLTVGTISTTAEAAIISGQVTGVWEEYDYSDYFGYELSQFKPGETFTAIYTYDSDNITNSDYSNDYYYDTYYFSSVSLLSLILNSGTSSYTFDLDSSGGYSYLQWLEVDYNDSYYGQSTDKGMFISAEDYTGAFSNYFQAYSYSSTDYYGSPYTSNYAYANTYDHAAYKYLGFNYSYQPVTFSGVTAPPPPEPTSVPEPSMLLGFMGLGLGVLGQRKAQKAAAAA